MTRFACTHTYRAPTMASPDGVRLFLGSVSAGYAVDERATLTANHGARVYRCADRNVAVLRLESADPGQSAVNQPLNPQALRELAGRLLDAANDIELHPAAALQRQAERSQEVTA